MKQIDRIEIMFEDMTGKFDTIMEILPSVVETQTKHTQAFERVEQYLERLQYSSFDHYKQLTDHENRIVKLENTSA